MRTEFKNHKLKGKRIQYLPSGEKYLIQSVYMMNTTFGNYLCLSLLSGGNNTQIQWEDIDIKDDGKLGSAIKTIIKRNKDEYEII